MKAPTTRKFLALFLAAALFGTMSAPRPVMAAEAAIEMGTTSNFAILAGETITNTGPTEITGDVGLHPGTDVPGQSDIILHGAWHLGDAVAEKAKVDLVTAYDDAAGRIPEIISRELGGQTLTPGVYVSNEKDFLLTGTLTLDAEGDPYAVFIFQTDTTLITASASSVVFLGGATACDVFWKVGSSATLGAHSTFAGTILALTSITLETGATVRGQLLARNGSVTLDSNRIVSGPCQAAQSATLHIIKRVVDESANAAQAEDFTIHVQKDGVDVDGSPASGMSDPGSLYTLAPGDYTVTEAAVEGYVASYSGDSTDGTITLAPGDAKTIIITNTTVLGRIHLVKEDDHGHPLPGAEFTLYQDDVQVGTPKTTDENGALAFDGLVQGTYALKETKAPMGYVQSDVLKEVHITENNETVEVTFTNTRITGDLTLIKVDAKTGSVLAGAEFVITDTMGTEVYRGITDEKGILSTTLFYGAYSIQEVTAPKGYVKNDTKHAVDIATEGQVIRLTVENTAAATNTATLPLTGSGSSMFYLVLGTLAMGGGLLLMRKRTLA